ncbi:uncharacterized protein [Phyllobates terribilis]|uniref:uncharacterized protein n=1 Tax=Phyllobates terribilis TaxID=111132 RepID=UPI003CCA8A37
MDKNHISEKILKLTLEIIYLLTGEDYSVVNKAGKHGGTIRGIPCQPEGLLKMVSPVIDPPALSEVYEKNKEQKILHLTKKILALLSKEVPIRCEDIIICFSMEEWEYVQGHKDLYKHLMMENHPFLGSNDFPSSDNLSMKLNFPMLSPDVACEDHSLTLCKPKARNSVFEDEQKVTLQTDNDQCSSLSTCTKYTQTEPADSEGVLSEDTEADVIYIPPKNTLMGSSSDAYTAYNEGNPKDSNICLLTEQIQNTPDENRSEVESSEDGILAVDDIYTPTCVKSTDLSDRSTQWGNNVNFVECPMSPHHINPQYMSSCIIEVQSDCEEGNVTHTDVYTPTAHKTALYTSDKMEEIPISWGKDVVYTNVYTPVELIQADLSSIKKELVSWKDGSRELQNIYIPSKPMGEKAASTSCRDDAVQWNGGHAHPHSSPLLQKISPHIKTEEHFADYCETAGQTQPTHAPVNLEDYNDDLIKKEMLNNMSTDYENDHGRPEYTTSQMYSCSDCNKCFSSDTNLAKHRLMCRGRKPHVCSKCGKCFASASYLVVHERIHTGEKPYSCSHCGKSFSRKPDLIRHERIHTGEKPFACPECGKCFTSVSNIFMHRRIHTGEKPFPCGECGKRFIKKSDLVRHQKIHLR